MQIKQINGVDAQARYTCFAGLTNIGRLTIVLTPEITVLQNGVTPHYATLRGEKWALTRFTDKLSDQAFILTVAIKIGRIEHLNPL